MNGGEASPVPDEPRGRVRRLTPIPAERQARVIDFLRRAGAASIHRIAEEIEASLSTVRRDLDELTERGYLERTHGGAVLRARPLTSYEPSRDIAGHLSAPAKAAIGRRAAEMIETGQSVIFDSSSTVLEAARSALRRDLALTCVTTDLDIARELARSDRMQVILPGGTLRRGSLTLVGEPGLAALGGLSADLAFIGMHALGGFKASETTLEITAMKRALIACGRRVVLLADSSKFEGSAFATVCGLDAFHDIVTDTGLDDELRRALLDRGATLTLVDADDPR